MTDEFVIASTGKLWHLYRQDRSGRLMIVRHDSLPAFTAQSCFGVIVSMGFKVFTVRVMGV